MTQLEVLPLLISVDEAAKTLGIGRTTAWALIKRGTLDTVRIGRRTLVTSGSVRVIAKEGIARVASDEE
jgi:excisionase family DNA binding protein